MQVSYKQSTKEQSSYARKFPHFKTYHNKHD